MKHWKQTRDFLNEAEVPQKTSSYSPIPHSVFLDEIKECVHANGWNIKDERYMTASHGQLMTGWYGVGNNSTDLELTPSISFTNSYNKTRMASVRCSAMVLVCKNGMMGVSENGSYVRKHSGNALEDFREHMHLAINGMETEFQRLVTNKNEMKEREITRKTIAYLIGDMYINEKLISCNQLSILKDQLVNSEAFKGDTLWDFYNNTTEAFKDSHPLYYGNQHIKFHTYISDKFGLYGSRGLYGAKMDELELEINN